LEVSKKQKAKSKQLRAKKYFSTPLDNIQKKSIFARLKILDYYP